MQIYGNWEEGLHIHYANLKRAGLDVLCKTVKIIGVGGISLCKRAAKKKKL